MRSRAARLVLVLLLVTTSACGRGARRGVDAGSTRPRDAGVAVRAETPRPRFVRLAEGAPLFGSADATKAPVLLLRADTVLAGDAVAGGYVRLAMPTTDDARRFCGDGMDALSDDHGLGIVLYARAADTVEVAPPDCNARMRAVLDLIGGGGPPAARDASAPATPEPPPTPAPAPGPLAVPYVAPAPPVMAWEVPLRVDVSVSPATRGGNGDARAAEEAMLGRARTIARSCAGRRVDAPIRATFRIVPEASGRVAVSVPGATEESPFTRCFITRGLYGLRGRAGTLSPRPRQLTVRVEAVGGYARVAAGTRLTTRDGTAFGRVAVDSWISTEGLRQAEGRTCYALAMGDAWAVRIGMPPTALEVCLDPAPRVDPPDTGARSRPAQPSSAPTR